MTFCELPILVQAPLRVAGWALGTIRNSKANVVHRIQYFLSLYRKNIMPYRRLLIKTTYLVFLEIDFMVALDRYSNSA